MKKIYDFAPTFGGPIKQDKLWFFLSARRNNAQNYASNLFENLQQEQADDSGSLIYAPDLTKRAVLGNPLPMAGLRLTWQASPRNKFGFSFDYRDRCQCPNLAGGGTAPEAAVNFMFRPQHIAHGDLVVAGHQQAAARSHGGGADRRLGQPAGGDAADTSLGLLRVTTQNTPASFLNITTYRGDHGRQLDLVSVPRHRLHGDLRDRRPRLQGGHRVRLGLDRSLGDAEPDRARSRASGSNFATGAPVPNQFTINTGPDPPHRPCAKYDGGVYIAGQVDVQAPSRWAAGCGYEFFNRYTAEVTAGPALLLPNRNITFPQETGRQLQGSVAAHGRGVGRVRHRQDRRQGVAQPLRAGPLAATPTRAGASAAELSAAPRAGRGPTATATSIPIATGSTRRRRTCRARAAATAAAPSPAPPARTSTLSIANVVRTIKDTTFGFNHRGYNWEFSTSVQQELVPRQSGGRRGVLPPLVRELHDHRQLHRMRRPTTPRSASWSRPIPGCRLSGDTISGFLDINRRRGRPTTTCGLRATTASSRSTGRALTSARAFGRAPAR